MEGHGQGQDCTGAVLDRASARTALVGTPAGSGQTRCRGMGGQGALSSWPASVSHSGVTGGSPTTSMVATTVLATASGAPLLQPPVRAATGGAAAQAAEEDPVEVAAAEALVAISTLSISLMNSGSSAPRQRHASASCVQQQFEWYSTLFL